jgi:bifunctional non-homologous end joining protein LigD
MRLETHRRKSNFRKGSEPPEEFSRGGGDSPESVKSAGSIEPTITRDTKPKSKKKRERKAATTETYPGDITEAKRKKLPAFVRPQLATLVDFVPQGDDWLHEIKFDGYRVLCRIDKGRATFLTREEQDWTRRFGSLVEAAQDLPVKQAFLDGEVVALEENGMTNFQLLQNSLKENNTAILVYFVFDLLYLDGWDLTRSPLRERKKILEKILKPKQAKKAPNSLRYSEHWIGQGDELYQESCRKGLEGIISKKANQPYRSGRSRDWLKVKCSKNQEFVIGGFTEPAGSRSGLGALLVGVHNEQGNFLYAGRVGTGFTQQSLKELRSRLNSLERDSPPFINPPKGAEARGVHWVEPKLVGAVAFAEWTTDNLLRHPSFQGLREDKPAAQVTRENVSHQKKSPGASSQDKVEIAGIRLTHPDRVLYPDQGITKLELARYYEQVADWMLPHVEGRPLTLVRCPSGHKKQCFYQRHVTESLGDPIRSISVKEGRSTVSYVAVDSTPGLIALVQMGVLEIHTWGSRQDHLEQPDRLTFDLDPDPALSWQRVREAAQALRKRLSGLGFGVFVKTTGGKGLHVVVPITPNQDWDSAKAFARKVAEDLTAEAPELYIATMSKAKRKGKIFIDYLRNARSATAISAYSTRAHAGAPVSVPLHWDELTVDVREEHFNIRNVPQRLARLRRDPWDGYEAARRPLTDKLIKTVRDSKELTNDSVWTKN